MFSPVCQFVSIASFQLWSLLGTTEKSLAVSCLHSYFRYLYSLMKSSLTFSSLGSIVSQPFHIGKVLQSYHHLHGPSLDSTWYVCLSCTGSSRTGPSTIGVASPVLNRGEGSLPSACWQHSSLCSYEYC